MTLNNNDRPIKLGMHTYTLHFFGLGESWGFGKDYAFPQTMNLMELMDYAVEWGLDGLQITKVDLQNTEPAHLAKIKAAAEERDLFLEFNASFDAPSDSRVNCTVREALQIAKAIGSDLAKFSLDVKRPRPYYATCFHPNVMRQLAVRYEEFKEALPLVEELGLKVAIENHCDTYADEVIWLVDQIDKPMIGTCLDTVNSISVTESPEESVKKLASRAFCCHFCDNALVIDPLGAHWIGVPHGTGDIDLPKVLKVLREQSTLDRVIFENEIPFLRPDEPLEEARKRELQACKESIAYLRNVLKVGVRNR
ncbi:sugar phosphate isomerase/epimerase family protein [Bacillus taeanensis]|uniref:sugar phosphate isomerase/epimerase family protein n=1 Tax=Bacillus taeanensis TaxID=273032 RepID=UPI001C68D4C5|nr:sugar phosphate isomerase/epimerase [Bacillus taeanensis]